MCCNKRPETSAGDEDWRSQGHAQQIYGSIRTDDNASVELHGMN